MVKNPLANAGPAGIQPLGWEDSLEEEVANSFQCSCLDNPWTEWGEVGGVVHGVSESDMTEHTHSQSVILFITMKCLNSTVVTHKQRSVQFSCSVVSRLFVTP